MSAGTTRLAVVDRVGRTVLMITGTRVAVFLAVVGSVLVLIGSIGSAAPGSPAWPGLVLAAVALLALLFPDGQSGLVALLGYGGWWIVAVDGAPLVPAFVASVAGLVLHIALAHASAGPGGAATEPATALSLLGAGLTVVAGTAALALVVAGVRGSFETPAVAVGVTLALLALLPWLAAARPSD